MTRYGQVDLYGVITVFILNILSVIYYLTLTPPNHSGAIVNGIICVLCIFSKQIATQFYGTSNINFIY